MALTIRTEKLEKLTIIEMDDNLLYLEELAVGGLLSTRYVYVAANGTPAENAQEFIEAYAKAVDAERDEDNRFTVLLSQGRYQFQETFEHNEDYINILSLSGEQDVIFDLNLDGDDPVVFDTPPPPPPSFQYVTDLVIDQNEGAIIQSDSLQSGQPNWLGTLPQGNLEVIFNNNGLGMRGLTNNISYPTYTLSSWESSDLTKVSCKFTYNYNTGDDYQAFLISLHDGSNGLPILGNNRQDQVYARIDNNGNLFVSNPYTGFGEGISSSLVDGETYTLELISNPSASIQQARVLNNTGTVVGSVSAYYYATTANYYRVSIGLINQGVPYYPNIVGTSSVMDISADYSKVSGIKTREYISNNYVTWTSGESAGESNYYPLPLNVRASIYDDLEVKNCTAGPFSFGVDLTDDNFENSNDLEATFTDCTALAYSFGYGCYQIESNSVFTDCHGGNNCFYVWDNLRGVYENCTAGHYSFYSNNNDIDGTFTNCTAGNYSFYSDDEDISSDSKFTNCTAGDRSFYADSDDIRGTFINCIAGENSFDADDSNTGTYRNCIAGEGSFDGDDMDGMDCYYCVLNGGTFDGGSQYYCVDDNYFN
jgi:hypothetical protein